VLQCSCGVCVGTLFPVGAVVWNSSAVEQIGIRVEKLVRMKDPRNRVNRVAEGCGTCARFLL
jgi:hypothetical protein